MPAKGGVKSTTARPAKPPARPPPKSPAKSNAPRIQPYVYTLNLKGGNKYVGYTQNLGKRLTQHFSGNGAQWTQKHAPVSVNSIQKVSTVAYAKKLETIIYYNMKEYHGGSKVRGAGNTRSY
jgi:predicted GIY-YIG superfamily endonuclease